VTVTGKNVKSVELIVPLKLVERMDAVVAVSRLETSDEAINGSVKICSGASISPVQTALSVF
jgi:hypothetical protein